MPKKLLLNPINSRLYEANKCANALARRGPLIHQDSLIFGSPLVDISMLLFYDSSCMYMYYDRILKVWIGVFNFLIFYQK